MSTFGSWTSPRHVERGVIRHILKWQETFAAEAERQFGLDPRTLPILGEGQFTTVRDVFQQWPENQTPACLVIAPGLQASPRHEADGSMTAPVVVALGLITTVSGFVDEPGAAGETAQVLGLVFREIMLSLRPDTDDFECAGIDLVDERYTDVGRGQERTQGRARVIFTVWVKNWGGFGRPRNRETPPEDPYLPGGDWPTVAPDKLFLSIVPKRPEEGLS